LSVMVVCLVALVLLVTPLTNGGQGELLGALCRLVNVVVAFHAHLHRWWCLQCSGCPARLTQLVPSKYRNGVGGVAQRLASCPR
jgi:hypothetical protein